MAFTFNAYRPLSDEEINPYNGALNQAFKTYGNINKAYSDKTKNQFLQPQLQEQLRKAQQENEWYAPNMQSQIDLRGAHAGLLGEQTKGAHIENEFLPKKLQAQIAESQANAQKARLLQMIREQMLGGGMQNSPGFAENGQNSMGMPQPGQGQGMFPQDNAMQQSQSQPQQPGMGYAQAATAMQMLGLGKPHVVNANGKYMAITPFGNIDTGISGLSEQGKELSKLDAKKIGNLENVVLNNSSKLDTFNELNSILGSKEFEAMRQNPVLGQHELSWYSKFGTPEQQDMVGKSQTFMGNIIKDSARDFAGQFRVGEQALLNSMKPNLSDSLDVMKGKAESLTYLTKMMSKRAEMEADFMRNYGMSPLQAKIAADRNIDSKAIKEEIRTLLHPSTSPKITADEARIELQRRKSLRK